MLSELGNDVRKFLLAGIGAAAVTVEKSEEIIKELIKKGELTVEQGKSLGEELKHKVCPKSSEEETLPDIENLSAAQRAKLKAMLEELESCKTPEMGSDSDENIDS